MNDTSVKANRTVYCEDAIVWLTHAETLQGCSLVASLPDISEFSNSSLHDWKAWFKNTAGLIMQKTPDDGVAVFYQSDIKMEGSWVDKGYLCQRAAEEMGLSLLWHKIFCRIEPGRTSFGRPGYSHVLCFSKDVRCNDLSRSTPDVVADMGEKTWERGMGLLATKMIAEFIKKETATKTLVQPFCGQGAMLAMANCLGLDAVGIERSHKRAEVARNLTLSPDLKHFIR